MNLGLRKKYKFLPPKLGINCRIYSTIPLIGANSSARCCTRRSRWYMACLVIPSSIQARSKLTTFCLKVIVHHYNDANRLVWKSVLPNIYWNVLKRLNKWPTSNSSVIPMPP